MDQGGYALGEVGSATGPGTIVPFWYLYFLTNIAKLDPALAGLSVLIGKVWDAINDPLVGMLSDRTRSRWGRPYLLFGAVPFGATFALLWIVPPIQSQGLLCLYFAGVCILFDTAVTLAGCPYSALTPEWGSFAQRPSSHVPDSMLYCPHYGKEETMMRKLLALLCFLALLGTLAVSSAADGPARPLGAMPPHPDLRERIARGELQLPAFMTDAALRRERGIDQPAQYQAPTSGTWKAIALLVQFSDNPSQVGPAYFDTLLFGEGGGTLPDYYGAVSYGMVDIVTVNLPSTIGWLGAPQTYAYYVYGQYGFGPYPHNAQKLAEDAVALADPVVDFSQYDNNGDGWVDTVFVIHAGQGAEFTGNPNHIWSHSWETVIDPFVDGVHVNSYTTEPEYWSAPGDMTIGVYAHELGHALGLPDLYDYDGSSTGVGNWSLMSYGSWNGPWPGGGSPAFMDAFCRAQLGYAVPMVVPDNLADAPVPQAETSQTIYQLWTEGTPDTEYFLVENRQQVSYDAYLPAAGLLVWHVDETRWDNDHECYELNNWLCGADHFRVALEQADGLWQLEHGASYGDANDPFPGGTVNRTFDWTSVPNSSSYWSSSDTLVGVTDISDSGSTMTADLLVSQPTMHVQAIEGEFVLDPYGRTVLRMRVLVKDEDGIRLGEVMTGVSIWAPSGGPYERARPTRNSGWAIFQWGSQATGTWRLCVDDLVKVGYLYDPADNVETCQEWYN